MNIKKNAAQIVGLIGLIIICDQSQAHAYSGINESIGYFLIFLLVTIVIFLICREIVCWYFKINERLSVLLEIRDLLRKSQGSGNQYLNDGASPPSDITCSKCGKSYPENVAGSFCENCGAEFSGQKKCPKCGRRDVYGATTEGGGWGDYCPHCEMSLQQMKVQGNK